MKNVFRMLVVAVVAVGISSSAKAQQESEKGVTFNVSGDFVSSYVWRGMYQGAQACVQPTLGVSLKGFSLSAWGSTSLADVVAGHKEVDLTLGYEYKNLWLQITDYWWSGQNDNQYFHYRKNGTGHYFEAGVGYTLPCEKFPLSISWYTMFAGNDLKMPSDKQAFSSYSELGYPFSVKGVDLEATFGFVPFKSETELGYDVEGFAVTNIALKATKEIRFSKSFSMPLFTQLIFNPASEDVHLVLGFTLR